MRSYQKASAIGRKTVMISSTARDLPEHRDQIKEACLRQGMFPLMMEHLPASDASAIEESLRMVDEADIYLGVFAFRYGYIPRGHDISITEMEYNRAVERSIPRLLFLMHEKHPLTMADVERGEGATKLEALKERVRTERVVNSFTSPVELQAQVINSLSYYRQPNLSAFHFISDIPVPPKPYIAHPYTLLQTQTLVGRQAELNLLTNWVAEPTSEMYHAHILTIVAMGGMGKSAFTWKWFLDIAPNKIEKLSGRMWWSFYESDATFENFVNRALAYVTQRAKEDIQKLSRPEREEQLLTLLDREPYLLVLDGLERMLMAYSRMDAAHLADDDLDQQTANTVAGMLSLPEGAVQPFTEQHRLRRAADPHMGIFLRKLAQVRAARILITSRLYPADLQTAVGSERPGCKAVFLQKLSDDDALNLWRAFGISGSREALLPLFHTFDNHPLLVQALAGEVAHDRRSPGNFDHWQKNHPDFNPFSLPLVQVKSHVLTFALRGLDEMTSNVLKTIAAFRMPATYDTLVALLVGKDKAFSNESMLVAALATLEDRGLLGWDRQANRYDLHPIVRGVTWSGLDDQTRRSIYKTLNVHFASLPTVANWRQVSSLDDLTESIELYNTLIGLERYDDAIRLFESRLDQALLYRLGASRKSAELLEMLFPDGLDRLPPLGLPEWQAYVYMFLANSLNEYPERAASLYRRHISIYEKVGDWLSVSTGLRNLSAVLWVSGALRESETAARQATLLVRKLKKQYLTENYLDGAVSPADLNHSYEKYEAVGLYWLGMTLAARGIEEASAKALDLSMRLARFSNGYEPYDYQAIRALWFGQYSVAQQLANSAMLYCQQYPFERGMIRAARLQGAAALGLGQLSIADERRVSNLWGET